MSVFHRQPFSDISETTGPTEAKIYVKTPWDGRTKVYSNGLGHITKMAAMPFYGKTLKNLLRNQQAADDHETLNTASGTTKIVQIVILGGS